MKVKTVRLILLICTLLISLLSIFSIMGLAMGFVQPLWIAFIIGGNVIILLFNAIMLYVIGIDKTWWNTKDQLDERIESYNRKCTAYERATEDLIQVQLKYYYDNVKEKYHETLKKLAD